MKQETITFTDTAKMRKGFCLIGQGIKTAASAIGGITDAFIHRYPYPFIIATIIAATLIAVVNIGKARAERDRLNRQCYELQQKLDSVYNEMEAKEKKKKSSASGLPTTTASTTWQHVR